MRLLCLLVLLLLAPFANADFKLDDGDRVVLLGSTLVEREQRSGWWELALTSRFPGKKITFRNLGWSGDTVFGEAHVGYAYTRTGQANVDRGFKHLVEHTLSLKPTVLIIGYGTNESFAGEKGLPNFVKGLNKLLDALAETKARVVLLSPMRQADMGRPLPDPAKNNKNLRIYADAVKEVASKRKATFVDLYDLLGDPAKAEGVTENGIHLTAKGYRWSAGLLAQGLTSSAPSCRIELDLKENKITAKGAKVQMLNAKELGFAVTQERLHDGPRELVITGLKPGTKVSLLHNEKPIATATAAEWAKGVKVRIPLEQLDKLRKAIVAKNELYFHRWRPQNETYLHGFRKHEQGRNAVEIPKFDPLVEEKEKAIAELTKPAAYTLEVRLK